MPEQDTLKQGLQQKPAQDAPQQEKKKKQSPLLTVFAILLMFIFTCLVGYIAYIFGKEAGRQERIETTANKTSDNEKTDDTTTTSDIKDSQDENEYHNYTSSNFNIKFSYPSTWGDVNERLLETEGTEEKEVIITFSNNPYLSIEGVTSDFDPGAIGDACPILAYFKGWNKSDGTICDQYGDEFIFNSSGPYYFGCLENNLGDGSISYYYGPTNHCAGYTGFLKILDINTSNTDYPGVRLVLEIANSENKDLAEIGNESSTISDEYLLSEYEESYLKIWEAIKDDIENGSDYITKAQLEEFDDFVETIEFIE